ncbi:MAP kinase [Aureococcus anophagefferens]|nr:MAP kinase [Aureococcus anophagefferens]
MSFRRKYHSVPLGRDQFYIDVRYTNLRPIGGGSYGVVCSADDTATGRRVAIKKIANVFSDLVDAKRILREIKLLRHFGSHENIVQVKDIITVPPNTIDFSDVYIVTNLMERARRVLGRRPEARKPPPRAPRSDLDRIITSRQTLTNQHHQYFLYQILRGLKYIHSASVLHRDLKPSNLLVNSNCDLAICDFGLARGFDDDAGKLTEYVVTRWYRAPELLCETATTTAHRRLHQLETIVSVLGKPGDGALEKIQHEAARKAIFAGAECEPYPFASYFPRDTSPTALDLLAKMLVFDPAARATVDAALEHPYLSELHGQMPEPLCDDTFDFEFERAATASSDEGKDALPKEEIQSMMFEEMVQLQLVMEDGGADAGAKAGAEGKDGEEDMATARTTDTADAK